MEIFLQTRTLAYLVIHEKSSPTLIDYQCFAHPNTAFPRGTINASMPKGPGLWSWAMPCLVEQRLSGWLGHEAIFSRNGRGLFFLVSD
ncbi:hypothetical protein AKJ16_DCAP17101 [Drosera capensis]